MQLRGSQTGLNFSIRLFLLPKVNSQYITLGVGLCLLFKFTNYALSGLPL